MKRREAAQILGVHPRTLYKWEERGQIDVIRTPGGQRLFDVEGYLAKAQGETTNDAEHEETIADSGRVKIIYARVSSAGQKDDLERQIQDLRERYPHHTLIKDIGSGVNLNRRGLRKIIDLAIQGRVKEVVISHKDRLARFGYELISDLIGDYSRGTVTIVYNSENLEPEEELVKDVLTIMNVFVARMNGMRKYRKRRMDGEQ